MHTVRSAAHAITLLGFGSSRIRSPLFLWLPPAPRFCVGGEIRPECGQKQHPNPLYRRPHPARGDIGLFTPDPLFGLGSAYWRESSSPQNRPAPSPLCLLLVPMRKNVRSHACPHWGPMLGEPLWHSEKCKQWPPLTSWVATLRALGSGDKWGPSPKAFRDVCLAETKVTRSLNGHCWHLLMRAVGQLLLLVIYRYLPFSIHIKKRAIR